MIKSSLTMKSMNSGLAPTIIIRGLVSIED